MADGRVTIEGVFDETISTTAEALAKRLEALEGGLRGLQRPADDAAQALEDTGDAAEKAADEVDRLGREARDAGRSAEQGARGIRQVGEESNRAQNLVAGLTRRLVALGGALLSIQGARRAIAAARDQLQAEARLAFALEGNRLELERILQVTRDIQATSIFGDEELAELAAQLRLAGVEASQLGDAIQLAADIASGTGRDLGSIGRGLTLLFQGSAEQLGRYIPELRRLTAEQIAAGEGVELLRRRFSGLAQALADTDAGNYERQIKILGDRLEDIGERILPFVNRALGVFNRLLERSLGPSAADRLGPVTRALAKLRAEGAPSVEALTNELERLSRVVDEAEDRLTGVLPELLRPEQLALVEDNIASTRRAIALLARDPGILQRARDAEQLARATGQARAEFERLSEFVVRGSAQVNTLNDALQRIVEKVQGREIGRAQGIALIREEAERLENRLIAVLTALERLTGQRQETSELFGTIRALREEAERLANLADPTFVEAFSSQFVTLAERLSRAGNVGAEFAGRLVSGIDGLTQAIFRGRDAVKQFFVQFLQSIAAAILRALVLRAILAGLGIGGAAAGSAGAAPAASVPGFYHGGLFTGSGYVDAPRAGYDNVNAYLTGNEYVQPSPAVDYYGVGVMEAMRRRLIPPSVFAGLTGKPSRISYGSGKQTGGAFNTIQRPSSGRMQAAVVADERTIDRLARGGDRTWRERVEQVERER